MNPLRLLVAVVAVPLIGCQASPQADADPMEFDLNEDFSLPGGREAVIRGEDLRLRFTQVLEDSRCPSEVECFWTGQARVAVLVEPAGHAATTVEFNTNPAPGQNVQTALVAPYTIGLQALEPYPRTIDEPIPLDDYRVTLSVRRTG